MYYEPLMMQWANGEVVTVMSVATTIPELWKMGSNGHSLRMTTVPDSLKCRDLTTGSFTGAS